jgi:Cu/Ag efflux pump CusA
MCDRTIKMNLKKGAILQEANSNTNSIELNVRGLDIKSFNYKKQTHVNTDNNIKVTKSEN